MSATIDNRTKEQVNTDQEFLLQGLKEIIDLLMKIEKNTGGP